MFVNIPINDESFSQEDEIYDNSEKNKEKNKKKMNKILRVILVILIIILLVFVTIFSRYLIRNKGNVKEAIKEMFRDAVGNQEPIFILVMGISEDISAELTDTIMLIGYNPDTNQAFVLSIPRDSFVGKNISNGGGTDKINALYQVNKKNPQKTIEAVEDITGVNIEYYVIVKTSVLVKIVNTLGGIDFDVPVDMDYDDDSQDLHIHLKAGQQKLDGDQAEQLVRFRHNNDNTSYPASYGDNDEGRTRTQREFLKTVAQKVIQTRDIDKIKSIAKDVFDNLETNIKWDYAVGYLPYAIDFKMEELEMQQLPGEMVKTTLWFFKVDAQKTKEMMEGYIQKLGLTDVEKKKYLKQTESKKIKSSNGTNSIKKNTTSGDNEKKTTTTNTTKKNTTEGSGTKKNTNTTNTIKKNNTTEKTNTTNKNNIENTDKNDNTSNSLSNESHSNGESSGSSSGSNNGNSGDSSSNTGSGSSESGEQNSSGSSESSGGSMNNNGSESSGGNSDSSSSSSEPEI